MPSPEPIRPQLYIEGRETIQPPTPAVLVVLDRASCSIPMYQQGTDLAGQLKQQEVNTYRATSLEEASLFVLSPQNDVRIVIINGETRGLHGNQDGWELFAAGLLRLRQLPHDVYVLAPNLSDPQTRYRFQEKVDKFYNRYGLRVTVYDPESLTEMFEDPHKVNEFIRPYLR
jgi:hypothetical protein